MSPTFLEKLFDTASAKHNGIAWTPSEDRQGAGLLVIDMGKRSSVTYLVVEFACQFDGRAFHLAKCDPGTDKEAGGYDVFVCRNGQDRSCTCKGFAYARGKDAKGRVTCKHVEAAIALLENRWI